jgi:hypothetical protein
MFDIKEWRRELVDAIRQNDGMHIVLLLDRIEAEWDAWKDGHDGDDE